MSAPGSAIMDSLFTLFKNLAPDLTKARVLDDLRNTRTMLEDLQDIYALAGPTLRNYRFKNREVQARVEKFKSLVGTNLTPVAFFEKNLPVIIKNLDTIKLAFSSDSVTNQVILGSVLSVKQANLLQLVSALYLVNKGARRFLVWMEAHESATLSNTENQVIDEVVPADEKWLADSFGDFCQVTKILTLTPDKIVEKLDSIVDARADDKAAKALAAAGRMSSADPFALGFIGTGYNPIVFGRMMFAEWQVKRYKDSEEELRGLKLQLSRLETLSKGKDNPALDQEVKYMRNRVNELSRDISEMEAKYA